MLLICAGPRRAWDGMDPGLTAARPREDWSGPARALEVGDLLCGECMHGVIYDRESLPPDLVYVRLLNETYGTFAGSFALPAAKLVRARRLV